MYLKNISEDFGFFRGGGGGQSGERSRNVVEMREQINFYILVCIIPLITSLKHARICLIFDPGSPP